MRLEALEGPSPRHPCPCHGCRQQPPRAPQAARAEGVPAPACPPPQGQGAVPRGAGAVGPVAALYQ